MWKIQKPLIELPPGFELREDEDRVYLYYGEVEVADFSPARAEPAKIQRTAQEYLEKISRKGN